MLRNESTHLISPQKNPRETTSKKRPSFAQGIPTKNGSAPREKNPKSAVFRARITPRSGQATLKWGSLRPQGFFACMLYAPIMAGNGILVPVMWSEMGHSA